MGAQPGYGQQSSTETRLSKRNYIIIRGLCRKYRGTVVQRKLGRRKGDEKADRGEEDGRKDYIAMY